MATLFLAMITSCIFFRSEDERTLSSEAISLGPTTLTPQQVSISIFSSLIVFPPVLVIAYLFSKSAVEMTVTVSTGDLKLYSPIPIMGPPDTTPVLLTLFCSALVRETVGFAVTVRLQSDVSLCRVGR